LRQELVVFRVPDVCVYPVTDAHKLVRLLRDGRQETDLEATHHNVLSVEEAEAQGMDGRGRDSGNIMKAPFPTLFHCGASVKGQAGRDLARVRASVGNILHAAQLDVFRGYDVG
jgi:hypothetical protein